MEVLISVVQGLEWDQLPQNPNGLELGTPQDGNHNRMVVRGVKQGTLACGSSNVARKSLCSGDSLWREWEQKAKGVFVRTGKEDIGDLEMWESHKE